MGANHSSPLVLTTLRPAIAAAAVVFVAAAVPHAARATTLQVLYDFCSQKDSQTGFCLDGSGPLAPVVRDANDSLFGTTGGGQKNNGTVFRFANGALSTLYNFCGQPSCTDGSQPLAGLVIDNAGNLYGTAKTGGAHGNGVVFELSPVGGGWNYTILHDFCTDTGCADGSTPTAALLMDEAGNLYGTTEKGGAAAGTGGTVFKMTRNQKTGQWSEQVLYAFCSRAGCVDGVGPEAAVIRDANGNIYGTTENGGKHNAGTVFKLSFRARNKPWREQVLHHFCSKSGAANSCKDGSSPVASLAMDSSGNLFGTTMQGGSGNPGSGIAFELAFNTSTGGYAYVVLHDFCKTYPTCKDGEFPKAAVILDGVGNLYGTTSSSGGDNADGSVFRIAPGGKETLLARFCGNFCDGGVSNGSTPEAPVIMDSSGNLFGTTHAAGAHQGGVLFEVTH